VTAINTTNNSQQTAIDQLDQSLAALDTTIIKTSGSEAWVKANGTNEIQLKANSNVLGKIY